MSRIRLSICLLAIVSAGPVAFAQDDLLTIGSPAPALDVEHWFPSEAGVDPVTSFESGKVYLVEFWATWCPPCVASMPHLADLQKEYAEEGVTIVSVSDEPLDTIEPFLDGEVRNYQGVEEAIPTYRELTSAYRLTTDPDGSTERAYMRAAAQNGIPTAFLVGKTGRIEWIGHPMGVDQVLADVVADAWDREAFAEQFLLQQRLAKLRGDLSMALRQGGVDAAFEMLDAFATENEGPDVAAAVAGLRASLTRQVFIMEIGQDETKDLQRLDAQIMELNGDPNGTNQLGWVVYQLAAQGRPLGKAVLQKAADATVAALDAGEGEANLLDTVSHLYYELGELDQAIAFQTRAAEHPSANDDPRLKAQIDSYLAELRQEKAAAEE